MKSLRELYIVGPGPSSSHTIGPFHAANDFVKYINEYALDKIIVTLYGSLALTGKGHKTDKIILSVLNNINTNIIFNIGERKTHPNTMIFMGYRKGINVISRTYVSVGGGVIKCLEDPNIDSKEVYPFGSHAEIKAFMEQNDEINNYVDFVLHFEDKDIKSYLKDMLMHMFDSIEHGISSSGTINASNKLVIDKVAGKIYKDALSITDEYERKTMLLTAYSYAVMEENASGNLVVTAPTCGSSGILPANLYYLYKNENTPIEKLIEGLMVGGLIGNLFKTNASVSGAVHGCQAEVGVATVMAAAAISQIKGLSVYKVEYAAELAMEHSLGLTCDPVDGYVVIPCIERNGIFALRAYESYLYAKRISDIRKNNISLDDIIYTMKITGEALSPDYKETSIGGLTQTIKK